ncbi:MAG: ribonuclease PH [Candidatus Krumholzibacteriota bacterium]|nr:ribonuclease PH [Candidatus Krumholzibacteriota bacterium]
MTVKTKRSLNQLRPIKATLNYIKSAPGSVLIEMGRTRVVCAATIENSVPPFLRGTQKGWITAEYGMLPRSSPSRIPRESAKGKIKGRTHEIQRLIGRSLRAVVDLEKIGERTIFIDCDVIEADGGTRCASINGALIAMAGALEQLKLDAPLLKGFVGAVSVGMIKGKPVLDLDYQLDSTADVDMNVVMNDRDEYIEIQGTAEGEAFSREELDKMLASAKAGIKQIIKYQKKVLNWRSR